MDKPDENCSHDWRIIDTQLTRIGCIYMLVCRRCGARTEAKSVRELKKLRAG